jgi:hypothetical protein
LGAATARKARSEGIDWSWAEKQLAHLERLGGHLLTPEALLKLELAGLVAQRPGKHFARNM